MTQTVLEVAATIIVAFGGTSLILIGCATWLGRSGPTAFWRRPEGSMRASSTAMRDDFERSHSRLKSELEKTVHVHRVQFETEFNAMADIWRKLSVLRTAMANLQPNTVELVRPGENEEERFARRHQSFSLALDALKRAVNDQSPFYTEDLLTELSVAIGIAGTEEMLIAVWEVDMPKAGWATERNKAYRNFKQSVDRVSDLIRLRLGRLHVVD